LQIQKFKKVRLFPRYKEEEIPEDWEINNVQSLLKIIDYRGRTPPFSDEGIIHLRSNNIRNGMINFDDVTFVSSKTYDKYMIRGIPLENDVLFTTEGPLGEVALVPKDFKFSLAQRIIVLRPKNSKLSSKFLKYLLLDRKVRHRYQGLSTGTTLGGIASKWFTKILLPYPKKISEQQKIAYILSNIDTLISSYDSIIETTKRLKQGLMQQLLTKGIGHKKFKKVNLFPKIIICIPEDWNLVRFGELISKLKRGPSKASNKEGNGFIYVTSDFLDDEGNIEFNEMKCLEKEKVDNPKTCLLEQGDLILNCVNSFEKIGKVAIFNSFRKKTIVGFNNYGITLKNDVVPEFLKNLFLLSFFKFIFQSISKPAINQVSFSTKDINRLDIPLPSISEQQKIATILNTFDSRISDLKSKMSTLEKLKKGLMQKLLTGQIRV